VPEQNPPRQDERGIQVTKLTPTRARTVQLLMAEGMSYDALRDICYWSHGVKGGEGRMSDAEQARRTEKENA
jgi:hypothetical protein